jgi:hypothetical protein
MLTGPPLLSAQNAVLDIGSAVPLFELAVRIARSAQLRRVRALFACNSPALPRCVHARAQSSRARVGPEGRAEVSPPASRPANLTRARARSAWFVPTTLRWPQRWTHPRTACVSRTSATRSKWHGWPLRDAAFACGRASGDGVWCGGASHSRRCDQELQTSQSARLLPLYAALLAAATGSAVCALVAERCGRRR